MESSSRSVTAFVIRAAATVSLGGILFGYDMGVVSGALPQLSKSMQLTSKQMESVVGFLYLGGGFGAAVGGYLCDWSGRRFAILITDVIFVIGAAILYFAPSYSVVILGRFVVGFAVSVSGCADVAYLTEVAVPEWRGSLVSCNEACISFGFLLAYLAGYTLSQIFPNDGWRLMFGLSAVVAVIQFLGMLSMPESPIWLASRGRVEEAKAALMDVHNFKTLEEAAVYLEMSSATEAQSTSSKVVSSTAEISKIREQAAVKGTLKEDMQTLVRQYYRQAIVAVFLSAMQQFCGHTNVLNFAPEIFLEAGLMDGSSLASTVMLGTVKFIVTVLVIWKIDFIRRKDLLLIGMATIGVSLILMSLAFLVEKGDEGNGTYNQRAGLAVAGAVGMAMGYASSFGPLTWLMTSEMFPSRIRGRALGASTIVTYGCATIVSYTFLSVQEAFGSFVPFLMYLCLTIIGIAFVLVAVPDTRHKSPEEISEDVQSLWFWKPQGGVVEGEQEDEAAGYVFIS